MDHKYGLGSSVSILGIVDMAWGFHFRYRKCGIRQIHCMWVSGPLGSGVGKASPYRPRAPLPDPGFAYRDPGRPKYCRGLKNSQYYGPMVPYSYSYYSYSTMYIK